MMKDKFITHNNGFIISLEAFLLMKLEFGLYSWLLKYPSSIGVSMGASQRRQLVFLFFHVVYIFTFFTLGINNTNVQSVQIHH